MNIDQKLQQIAALYLNNAVATKTKLADAVHDSPKRPGRPRSKLASYPDLVVSLYQSGQTLREIANFFGTSIRTVTNVLEESGVERRNAGRKCMGHLVNDAISFHKSGASLQEIGEKFGIAISTASKLLAAGNVDAGAAARARKSARSCKIARMYRAGFTMHEISEDFGMSVSSVAYHLNKMGVETRSRGRPKCDNPPLFCD